VPAETSSFRADLKPLTADEELERRKARAAKWGTEVKSPAVAKPAPAAPTKPTKPTKVVPAAPVAGVSVDVLNNRISLICMQDNEKIKARQTRFRTDKEPTESAAPVMDEAEARKRKVREERFGTNPGVRLV
jgi:Tho1/MOS11 C-terminal domain